VRVTPVPRPYIWGMLVIALVLRFLGRGVADVVSDWILLLVIAGGGVGMLLRAAGLSGPAPAGWRRPAHAVGAVLALATAFTLYGESLLLADVWLARAPADFDREAARASMVQWASLGAPGDRGMAATAAAAAVEPVRLVGLGESDHRTAEYSTAKASLIRELHRRHGFDVLLVETPTAPLLLALRRMAWSQDPVHGLDGLFPIWRTAEVQEVFAYVLETWQTDRPITVVGIDCQHVHSSWTSAREVLDEVLGQVDPSLARAEATARGAWDDLLARPGRRLDADDPVIAAAGAHYDSVAARLVAAADLLPAEDLEGRLLRRQAALVAAGLAVDVRRASLRWRDRFIARDRHMAASVMAMADEVLPGRRMMLWAHNGHLARRPDLIRPGDMNPMARAVIAHDLAGPLAPRLGQLLDEHYGDRYYALGLLATGGTMGSWNQRMYRRVRPRRRDAVERLLDPAPGEASFLDLRSVPGVMGGAELVFGESHALRLKARLDQQFDGVLVVRRVGPPTEPERSAPTAPRAALPAPDAGSATPR
jgi:erythromycin esterase